jgi:hypothetical protein
VATPFSGPRRLKRSEVGEAGSVPAESHDPLVEQYLELGLRLGKRIPDFVASYYGPAELAARVEEEAPAEPSTLREQAAELVTLLDDMELEDARRRWLRGQVRGLETAASVLAGERLSYAEEVEGCHGVSPTPVPEGVFADAHRRLDQALPGSGPVATRYQAWLSSQLVPAEKVLPALRSLAEELRERARRLFDLPEGDRVEFELVSGKPWGAFADYQGGFRSRIAVNTDLPTWSFRLLEFVAHEVYPGHHSEQVCREAELMRRRGYLEETVRFGATPQTLLSEGLAQLGLELALGEEVERVAAEHLQPLCIPYGEEVAAAVRWGREALGAVRTNILFRLDEQSMSLEQAHAYARRWLLEPDIYLDKAIESLLGRSWRSYESCYTEGLRLCRRFVGGDPRRFKRLLTEQLTPSDLFARSDERESQGTTE